MKREHRSFIISLLGSTGIVLIAIFIWFVLKEYRFKTYTDPDNNFSIKYPSTWTVQMYVGGAAAIFLAPLENKLDPFRESVNIVVQDISSDPMTLSQYSTKAIEQMRAVFGRNFELLDSSYYFMSGRPGHQVVFLGKGPDSEYKYKIIWTIDGTTVYQVTYTSEANSYNKYIKKVNLMMASFKIL